MTDLEVAHAKMDALNKLTRIQDFIGVFIVSVDAADWETARDSIRQVVIISAEIHRAVSKHA